MTTAKKDSFVQAALLISSAAVTHRYHWGPFQFWFGVDDWSPLVHVALLVCACISALLIFHLWRANPTESTSVKTVWTAILLIPVIGWFAYSNFGPKPTSPKNP